jgi:hypothetical protein
MKRIFLLTLCAFLVVPTLVWPQAVEVKEGEDTPLALAPGEGQTRGLSSSRPSAKPDRFTVRYIYISPGPEGAIEGVSADSTISQRLIGDFNFPSLNILLSVAARVVPDVYSEDSGRVDGKVRTLTELQQMCLHIKLSGLNADKAVIGQSIAELRGASLKEFGREPLLTLGIAPYESSYSIAESQESKISGSLDSTMMRTGALGMAPLGIGTVACYINPFGIIASGISAIFKIFSPTKNLPNQISYQSSATEFGWIWRAQQGYGIEGIHRCMALLRTHKSIKYILAEVELITDWKRFGAWVKKIDYIIPVASDQE